MTHLCFSHSKTLHLNSKENPNLSHNCKGFGNKINLPDSNTLFVPHNSILSATIPWIEYVGVFACAHHLIGRICYSTRLVQKFYKAPCLEQRVVVGDDELGLQLQGTIPHHVFATYPNPFFVVRWFRWHLQ